MARTINEIYNAIIAEKLNYSELSSLQPNIDSGQTLLDNLTSSSKVGAYRMLFYNIATAIHIHESLFDEKKTEIEALREKLVPATERWYREQALLFQYGDNLVWDSENYGWKYEITDTDSQIVKQATATSSGFDIIVKVAKEDSSNDLVKLSTDELSAIRNYFDVISPPGNISVQSEDPDDIKLTMDVFIDTTVLYLNESLASDPLNGSLLSDSTTFPVEDAINDYISSLDFKGKLYATKLTDAVQDADGVNNVVLNTLYAKYGSLSYSDILSATGRKYQSNAGYLAIDASFPLSDTITYYGDS